MGYIYEVLRMIKIVREAIEVDIDESDLITIDEAARISDRTIPTIAAMLDRGKLPWYELPAFGNEKRKRIQRYTSKREVLSIPKEKRH